MTSPQTVGKTVTLSATSAGCTNPNPLYRFWLQDPTGGWHIVRDYLPSASFVWDTSTYVPGTYLIGVWVKDASSTNSHDAYAFGTFTLEVPTCSSTNISSDVPSPQTTRPIVTFTATSLGCPTPLYQWWINNAGAWTVIPGHDFANSNAVFAWDTSGLADGTYQIGVWAKQQYSVKTHDAYAFNTYTLTTGPPNTTHCQAANIAVSPPSPSLKGTTVTLTASPVGCDNAEYRWWIQNTLGAWQIVQDYPSATSTYSWLTGSRPAGTYLLGVWVRQKGSLSSHEAYGYLTYTLTVPPPQFCSSVNLAPDIASPQAPGTTITFTGAANGCNNPSYQFWVLAPGTTAWIIKKPYSPSNQFAWDTAGLSPGAWQIGVWAKQTGATASHESFAFITYQLQVMAPPCATMTVTAAPGQIVERGPGAIQFAAVASGCSVPSYRLYLSRNNGPFVFWGYPDAATTTFTVPLAGLLNGHWTAEVVAKDATSHAAYDTVAFTDFTVN